MTKWISSLILGACSLLWAADRPEIPAVGIDTELIKNGDPRKFFEERRDAAKNPSLPADCVKNLDQAKQDFSDARSKLKDMKEAKEAAADIDAQGAKVLALKAAYAQRVEACGDCITRPVVSKVYRNPKKDLTWWVSHGTCQIPSTDPVVLKKAFDLVADSLVHTKRYSKPNGGFDNILDLQVVKANGADFEFLSSEDLFPASPVNMAIWVRGPKVPFTSKSFVFRYFMETEYETTKNAAGGREFELKFDTTKTAKYTSRLTFPDVIDYTPSGAKIEVQPWSLNDVMGQWYVTEDGYIRYFTAAVFPINDPEIPRLGRSILIDTLVDMLERGQGE